MLEAGNQEKVFTPLIGKGVRFLVGGKPADHLFLEIKQDMKDIEDIKKRLNELGNMFNNENLDSKDFSKKDIDSIKSAVEELNNTEKSKLQSYTSELAKKIKEYSDNKNK
jgi:alanyl-tRNA synthetase